MPRHRKPYIDIWSGIIIFSLIVLDLMVWQSFIPSKYDPGRIYFLNVKQGEAALTILPGNVKILTDAGNDSTVAAELPKILSNSDQYIDLAVISYPQSDNYDGFISLLDRYAVGAFVYDGRNDVDYKKDWQAFLNTIAAKHIPLLTLGAGDAIRHGNDRIEILSPNSDFVKSPDLYDISIVQRITTSAMKILFMSDAGANVQNVLLNQNKNISADILKISLSAIPASSTREFLHKVGPKIIVATPGIKATPSQFSNKMLQSLASSTHAMLLSTDSSGTIGIFSNNGTFLLYNE